MTSPRPLAALVLAGLLLASPAAAQRPAKGVFGINPSLQEVTAVPEAALRPVVLTNSTSVPLAIDITPRLMRQNLDGSYLPIDSVRSSTLGGRILTVTPSRFTLPGGSRRRVALRWTALQPGRRGAYVALSIIGTPPGVPGQIQNRYELVGLNFLRRRGARESDGEIVSLRGEQGENRTLLFHARVRNGGRVHGRPFHGSTKIYEGERLLVKENWEDGIVIPRYDRAFPVTIDELLPAGTYRAVSTMRWNGRISRAERRFTLVGPNELPTTKLRLDGIAASGTIGGSGAVSVGVTNLGTTATRPAIDVRLFKVTDQGETTGPPVATESADGEDIAVGQSGRVTLELGEDLELARYRVTVLLRAGRQPFGRRDQDFQPGEAVSSWDDVLDALRAAAPWIIAFLAVGGLVFVLLRDRRRRGRSAPGPAAPAPPPASVTAVPTPPAPLAASVRAAPPPPAEVRDRIDLNGADAAQLATLPGIGPKMAQRIIEHREEHGAFEGVDGLRQVPGFGPARVDALRGRAGV